jgi:hypothetical protein
MTNVSTDATTKPSEQAAENQAGFFINAGTHTGWFTTPDGDAYDIRKLEPREVTDPRTGEVSTVWGGYPTARDRDLAAKDAMLQAEFKKTGARPTEFFQPESRDIPLYITLRNRPGKANPETGKPTYSDIGSFWNARGRYTILARDLSGKGGLRFGGNVLAWKTQEMLEAERATKAASAPDGEAAREGAERRVRKSRDRTPSPQA